ncbi:hypothetical protein K503DRAFT_805291 [Rhizopogon vinicolor AM-OR11-026]|uniref:Uncharacterized protein n=1 Tax=Rhizopogon vinicolor AM-OR11-026 TaxID=1314800 RepID=A0A1B7MID1_9AGAM|nr:hypothetical protein K503DRAFT_805291 [Rhizopogon vinicolor AM-OR11-026]
MTKASLKVQVTSEEKITCTAPRQAQVEAITLNEDVRGELSRNSRLDQSKVQSSKFQDSEVSYCFRVEFARVGQRTQGYASQARRANQGFRQAAGVHIHAPNIMMHLTQSTS